MTIKYVIPILAFFWFVPNASASIVSSTFNTSSTWVAPMSEIIIVEAWGGGGGGGGQNLGSDGGGGGGGGAYIRKNVQVVGGLTYLVTIGDGGAGGSGGCGVNGLDSWFMSATNTLAE